MKPKLFSSWAVNDATRLRVASEIASHYFKVSPRHHFSSDKMIRKRTSGIYFAGYSLLLVSCPNHLFSIN